MQYGLVDFCSFQPTASLHSEVAITGLVYHMPRLFTLQLLLVLIGTYLGGW